MRQSSSRMSFDNEPMKRSQYQFLAKQNEGCLQYDSKLKVGKECFVFDPHKIFDIYSLSLILLLLVFHIDTTVLYSNTQL